MATEQQAMEKNAEVMSIYYKVKVQMILLSVIVLVIVNQLYGMEIKRLMNQWQVVMKPYYLNLKKIQ